MSLYVSGASDDCRPKLTRDSGVVTESEHMDGKRNGFLKQPPAPKFWPYVHCVSPYVMILPYVHWLCHHNWPETLVLWRRVGADSSVAYRGQSQLPGVGGSTMVGHKGLLGTFRKHSFLIIPPIHKCKSIITSYKTKYIIISTKGWGWLTMIMLGRGHSGLRWQRTSHTH